MNAEKPFSWSWRIGSRRENEASKTADVAGEVPSSERFLSVGPGERSTAIKWRTFFALVCSVLRIRIRTGELGEELCKQWLFSETFAISADPVIGCVEEIFVRFLLGCCLRLRCNEAAMTEAGEKRGRNEKEWCS